MPLREAQYQAVLDFVGEVHDAQDPDELRALVLPALRRMVPADYSSYNEVAAGGAEQISIVEPEVPEFAHDAWSRLATTNPLVERVERTRDGRAYRFSDVVTQAELRRLPLYREIYRRIGVEHQIAFTLPSPRSLIIGIALSRGRRARDFDDDEREMLNLVRPHLIQAVRNAQLQRRAAEVLAALATGLEARGSAVVVVGAAGQVELATDEARRMVPGIGTRLPEALRPALSGEAVRTLPGPLLVHRVRAGDGTRVLFLDRPGHVLTADSLLALGLTPREAAVLGALAHGRSTAEAAADLGVSPRTILKHAERVHRKLGVRDRAQAVATAWTATEAARR